jgi:hexosaminidase
MKIIYKKNTGVLGLVLFLFFAPACKKNSDNPKAQSIHAHGIIPLPLNVDLSEGNLSVNKDIVLVNSTQFQPAIAVVEHALNQVFNSPVIRNDSPTGKTNIRFTADNTMDSSAYEIEITVSGINIKAKSAAGAYYAAQSIRQMIWNATSGLKPETFDLRMMTIQDKPRYAWRGFHLDVARHFFNKEYILKIIDWLAYYKINKLQLHLTDDQGWRVEIDQFPLLTEIGAWRSFNALDSACMELAKTDINYTIDPRFIKDVNGQKIYGGYYTKQDIREIVAYASDHYIDVIPEIDMPGHMSAAIRAYPQLSCVDSAGWGTEFSFPICPCNPDVMDFSYRVWDEIADLFPSKVLHIGCDEVEKATWASSPECQLFLQEHGMTGLNEIQNYFVRKLQEHLEAKGKTVIAWDDVMDGNVDNHITMMYWRDWVKDSPERCAQNGNPIILAPWSPFYLSSAGTDEDLQNLFMYNPSDLYPADVLSEIQGMQSCIWTEKVPSEAVLEQLAFPGLQALSEVCWSKSRDWSSFKNRMKTHFIFMDSENIHYRRPGWMN